MLNDLQVLPKDFLYRRVTEKYVNDILPVIEAKDKTVEEMETELVPILVSAPRCVRYPWPFTHAR